MHGTGGVRDITRAHLEVAHGGTVHVVLVWLRVKAKCEKACVSRMINSDLVMPSSVAAKIEPCIIAPPSCIQWSSGLTRVVVIRSWSRAVVQTYVHERRVDEQDIDADPRIHAERVQQRRLGVRDL